MERWGKTAHYPNPLPGTSLLGAVIGLRGQIAPLHLNYDAFVGAPLKSQITSRRMITRLGLA